MKLHEILPGQLYQRGLTRGVRTCLATVAERNVGAVACLVRAHDRDLMHWLEEHGGTYLYFPFADGTVVPEQLPELARRLAEVIRGGRPVIVHCRAGRNRSGLLSALVVREVLGIDGRSALQHVQLTRPNALANEAFAEYLRRLPAP